MENEIIVVKQLPIIEEQLRTVQKTIQARVNEVLAMECTEDTYKEVKKARAELNAQYKELEARRKEVKAKVQAPYLEFERVYKAFAGDLFTDADKKLSEKISVVESGLRKAKADAVKKYFDEYRDSLNLPVDLADFSQSGISVTLSATEKALKSQAKTYIDKLRDDLSLIARYEHQDEIIIEYRRCRNAACAVETVYNRHAQIEEERRRREEEQEAMRKAQERDAEILQVIAEEEQLSMPETMDAPADEFCSPVTEPVEEENTTVEATSEPVAESVPRFSVAFKVTGTIEQLKAMKKFLTDGGYEYEQLN